MEVKLMIPTQQGGSLLGQGLYGCIFTPPLVCRNEKEVRGNNKKQSLGKLSEAGDVESEIDIALIFKNKPEAKKYFILPDLTSVCIPAPLTKQKEDEIDRCGFIEKHGVKENDMVHYQMPYGGKTLHETFGNTAIKFPFFVFMNNMLEIGAYLALNGVVHNDMHNNNILVNKSYEPRMIDFGRAYSSQGITEKVVNKLRATYMPELGQIPPEASVIDGIDQPRPLPFSKIMEDIRTKKPGLVNVERVLGVDRQQEITEFQHFWKTSKASQQKDWVSFMKLYWSVVDSWSIGNLLIGFLWTISLSKQFSESTEWKQKQGVVKSVLKGLLKLSPRVRLDCVEALALYDPMNAVLSTSSGKAWLRVKEAQRLKMRAP